MLLFHILIDLQEGHYKLHFKSGVNIDQFYVHLDRKFCTDSQRWKEYQKCRNGNPSFDRKLDKKIINSTWNSSSTAFVPPINATLQDNGNESLLSWYFETNKMAMQFQKCYRYKDMYHHFYDEFPLKISVHCKISNMMGCNDCNCSCNWKRDNYTDRIILFLEYTNGSCLKDTEPQIIRSEMLVNLVCIVYKEPSMRTKGIAYGFSQPIVIHLPNNTLIQSRTQEENMNFTVTTFSLSDSQGKSEDSTTSSKTSSQKLTTSGKVKQSSISIAVLVIVITLLFGATISLIVYFYIKRRKITGRLNVDDKLKTKNLTIKRMDNQDYESSITDEKDGKDLVESNPLPDWLKMRPEMIYDSSCIERGKELGHGHFGAVYEGTIRFGNAM